MSSRSSNPAAPTVEAGSTDDPSRGGLFARSNLGSVVTGVSSAISSDLVAAQDAATRAEAAATRAETAATRAEAVQTNIDAVTAAEMAAQAAQAAAEAARDLAQQYARISEAYATIMGNPLNAADLMLTDSGNQPSATNNAEAYSDTASAITTNIVRIRDDENVNMFTPLNNLEFDSTSMLQIEAIAGTDNGYRVIPIPADQPASESGGGTFNALSLPTMTPVTFTEGTGANSVMDMSTVTANVQGSPNPLSTVETVMNGRSTYTAQVPMADIRTPMGNDQSQTTDVTFMFTNDDGMMMTSDPVQINAFLPYFIYFGTTASNPSTSAVSLPQTVRTPATGTGDVTFSIATSAIPTAGLSFLIGGLFEIDVPSSDISTTMRSGVAYTNYNLGAQDNDASIIVREA